MCWRQVSKLQKTVLIVLFYTTVYVLASYCLSPESSFSFIRDELRVGDKYALIYLIAPRSPVFSNFDGAEVFKARRCGNCFVTNNKGFLPANEFDAVLVHGESLLEYTNTQPSKRYLIETNKRCIRNKMKSCSWEPEITSFVGKERFDLCGLCEHLHKIREKPNS